MFQRPEEYRKGLDFRLSEVRPEGGWLAVTASDGTHVEDAKDPVEVRHPGGDFFFIVVHPEDSADSVPSPPLGDLRLDIHQNPVVLSGRVNRLVYTSLVELT